MSIAAGLFGAEAMLRLLERRTSADSLDYPDTWRQESEFGIGGFLAESFSSQVVDGQGGSVEWTNNSQGFRNRHDFDLSPLTGVVRILSIGDSFTAGYRVDQDATFSSLLEKRLRAHGHDAEVMVACTEDPVTGLDYLVRNGLAFRPHIVFLGLTIGNDIAQTFVALHPDATYTVADGQLRKNDRRATYGFRTGADTLFVPSTAHTDPGTLGRLRTSALSRMRIISVFTTNHWPIGSWYGSLGEPTQLFDPMHGLGVFLAEPPPEVDVAYEHLRGIMEITRDQCSAAGATLVVALFPQRFQVSDDDWTVTTNAYRLRADAFDRNAPNRRVATICAELELPLLDPTQWMRQVATHENATLYLPRGDMHWNAAGHKAFASAVFDEFLRIVDRHTSEH